MNALDPVSRDRHFQSVSFIQPYEPVPRSPGLALFASCAADTVVLCGHNMRYTALNPPKISGAIYFHPPGMENDKSVSIKGGKRSEMKKSLKAFLRSHPG